MGRRTQKSPSGHLREVIRRSSRVPTRSGSGETASKRGFMYIDDCLFGTTSIMESSDRLPDQPRKLRDGDDQRARRRRGEDRGVELEHPYELDAPKGVRGRSSDNTAILKELDWEPRSSRRRSREDVCLDLRSDDCTRSGALLERKLRASACASSSTTTSDTRSRSSSAGARPARSRGSPPLLLLGHDSARITGGEGRRSRDAPDRADRPRADPSGEAARAPSTRGRAWRAGRAPNLVVRTRGRAVGERATRSAEEDRQALPRASASASSTGYKI